MTAPTLPIETDRLQLRAFEPGDLEAMMAYHALPEVQRYMDIKVHDAGDAKAALNAMRQQKSLTRPGDSCFLAVERREDGMVLGQVSLRWADATAQQAELRFVFNPVYAKRGYAKEAVKAALTLGFDEFRFHRIFARCDARNQGSAKLMKGVGMRLEAHYREHALFQGEWDEELHFAILDREWQRSPKVRELTAHRVA